MSQVSFSKVHGLNILKLIASYEAKACSITIATVGQTQTKYYSSKLQVGFGGWWGKHMTLVKEGSCNSPCLSPTSSNHTLQVQHSHKLILIILTFNRMGQLVSGEWDKDVGKVSKIYESRYVFGLCRRISHWDQERVTYWLISSCKNLKC